MSTVRALIFGGTSEGRELAEFASANRIPVLISVVSEYGESLLNRGAYVRVRQGALKEDAMEELLRREAPELVLDATHPYARVVTGQVAALCEKLGIPCRRVVRDVTGAGGISGSGGASGADDASGTDGADLFFVSSPEAAAALPAGDTEPILLTTGSKELEVFAGEEHLKGRIYARVLPSGAVLEKCGRLGIDGAHLIAMQGPFSEEMNRAILHRTGAKWLVTKESGDRGGFAEKLRAAKDCGCKVIVIERPEREDGISLAEAKKLLQTGSVCAEDDKKKADERQADKRQAGRRIALIGMGMGGGSQLTLEAAKVLKTCDAVLGAPRMLRDVGGLCPQARREPLYLADQILDWMKAHPEYQNVGVIYSGDTGFYSGSSLLVEALKNRGGQTDPESAPCAPRVPCVQCASCAPSVPYASCDPSVPWQVSVYPGISSVSSLCARMQISWEGMHLASAHGRSCDVAELVKCYPRLFLLLGGAANLAGVCDMLREAGYGDASVTAGVRMGYPDERLITGTAEELCGTAVDGLTAIVIERRKKEPEANHER